MSLNLKSKFINNLRLIYSNHAYPDIAPKEIEAYVRSIDFLKDALHKTGIILIDYKAWKYLYCSSNIENILGQSSRELLQSGPDIALKNIHPEDLRTQQIIHPLMIDYFRSLPDELRGAHKFSFTYKYRRAAGDDLMILQNNIFIKWDELGNPIAKLILFTDISDYKKDDQMVFYITRMNDSGINEVVLQRSFAKGHSVQMTNRELQTIDFIKRGYSSKDIANKFQLSELTVKNVRKNIMKKLGCTNQAQMIRLASLYGLVPAHLAADAPLLDDRAKKQRSTNMIFHLKK